MRARVSFFLFEILALLVVVQSSFGQGIIVPSAGAINRALAGTQPPLQWTSAAATGTRRS